MMVSVQRFIQLVIWPLHLHHICEAGAQNTEREM